MNLQKNCFQCFHPECGIKGNVLDLWAAVHKLPLLDAAHHLVRSFNLDAPAAAASEKRNP